MKTEKNIIGNRFDIKMTMRLFSYIKPYASIFFLLLFLTILSAILSIAKPIIIRDAIDIDIAQGDVNGLLKTSIILLGLLLFHGLVNYLNTFLSSWLGQSIIRDIRVQLYKHLIQFRLSYFDNTQIGRLVTRNISDIESLSNVFSEGLAGIVSDILLILAILVIMFYENWTLTLYSLGAIPLLVISTYVFKEKVKKSFDMVRSAVANLNSFVQEHIVGMSVVQQFNSEKREFKKFEKINKEHRDANLKSVLYYSIYFPVAEFIASLSIALLVWYGAKSVIEDTISIGTLTSFVMYITMFFRPIRMIADRFNTIQLSIVSSQRIFNILDNTSDSIQSGNQSLNTFKNKIEFKNVWFAYKEEDFILKNISLEVNHGDTLAIVGATGAGKSSIINLLNRFYEINKGSIKIDSINIKDIPINQLRNLIGVVQQDVFLFSDSIYNNITLNNPTISIDQVWETIDMVNARTFIEKMPGGLQYNVLENGNSLSVGQRQLIAFIRTLLYNPKILVLDEATASIDSETELLVQNAIEKLMYNRTSIVIAHRLSTIKKANKIIVLEKGEIKESGTHEQLLALNGSYANLYNMQFANKIIVSK